MLQTQPYTLPYNPAYRRDSAPSEEVMRERRARREAEERMIEACGQVGNQAEENYKKAHPSQDGDGVGERLSRFGQGLFANLDAAHDCQATYNENLPRNTTPGRRTRP